MSSSFFFFLRKWYLAYFMQSSLKIWNSTSAGQVMNKAFHTYQTSLDRNSDKWEAAFRILATHQVEM
jgi:hypothetical protein